MLFFELTWSPISQPAKDGYAFDDTALYAFAEPGPGNHSVNAKRFPVSYDGGAVDIESKLGSGTTVRIYLPASSARAPPPLRHRFPGPSPPWTPTAASASRPPPTSATASITGPR